MQLAFKPRAYIANWGVCAYPYIMVWVCTILGVLLSAYSAPLGYLRTLARLIMTDDGICTFGHRTLCLMNFRPCVRVSSACVFPAPQLGAGVFFEVLDYC